MLKLNRVRKAFALAAAPLLAGLGGCVAPQSPSPAAVAAAEPLTATAEVAHDSGQWTADYRFLREARAWVFNRSALTRIGERPWRPQSWTVQTPGVRLERHGHYDVLVAENGGPVPAHVRIRFTPFARDLIADYDPALAFTDGSVALFTQQFDLFPLDSVEDAERLPIDLNMVTASEAARTRTLFRDAGGEVLYMGQRFNSASIAGRPAYVLFGGAEPIVTEAMATVIDPQLPAWLRTALAEAAPRILGHYAERLGPAPDGKPTFFVSWAGPTPQTRSMGGSVLPVTVTMRFEGDAVLEPNDAVRDDARWFVAPEGAHFWLGQAVRYEFSRDAWITEGGADLLAVQAVAALEPGYDRRVFLNRSIADCARLSRGRGVSSAQERNEHRAYYACGAVFGLVAEAASRRPFTAFVRTLIDANRGDGVLTRAEWLAELDRVSGDPSLSRDIGRMLDAGAEDPKAAIASLFTRAGVRFAPGEDGTPRLL
jgi:hypothetical protein